MKSLSFQLRQMAVPAIIAIAILAGCTGEDAATADSNAVTKAVATGDVTNDGAAPVSLPVAALDARDGDLILRVATTGQVRSEAVVPLRAEVAGTVAQLLVRAGDQVAAGTPLVKLDPYPFELAVREAQARAEREARS